MYIKQILYLLEKFVTVLGGKEPRARPTPACSAGQTRFPGCQQGIWVFRVLRLSGPFIKKILILQSLIELSDLDLFLEAWFICHHSAVVIIT